MKLSNLQFLTEVLEQLKNELGTTDLTELDYQVTVETDGDVLTLTFNEQSETLYYSLYNNDRYNGWEFSSSSNYKMSLNLNCE